MPATVSILLLEDTASDADLIQAALAPPEDFTFKIHHFERLREAIAALEDHDFDAALVDLNLPDAAGLDTVRALRAVTQLPLVVLSSVNDDEVKRQAREEGITEFISKWGLDGSAVARTLIYAAERNQQQKLLMEVARAHVDPTWLVDEAGIIVFSNEAAQSLAIQPGAPAAEVGSRMDFAGRQEDTSEHERVVDGESRTFEVKVSRLDTPDRPMTLVAARDITSRRRARELERQLYHADRLASIGRLASGVAHEVNNPAAFILANQNHASSTLDAAIEGLNSDASDVVALLQECKSLLSDNRIGTERIAAIVEQLLSFARADGQSVEALLVADAVEVARKLTLNDLHHRARFKLVDEQNRALVADRGKLIQLFTNLIVNAVDAITPGDADANEIRVEVSADDEAVTVRVRDTGVGIAPDDQERIFEPFFTTKPFGRGTGLGLSLCAEIVGYHQGTVDCASAVGQGTEFVITFPYDNGLESDDSVSDAVLPVLSRKPRVLFIDDDEFVRRAIVRELRKRYEVVEAVSAEDALRLFETDQDFDTVICDLMMPNVDGATLWRRAAESWAKLGERFLFLTGGGALEDSDVHPANVPTLRKPVDWNLLDHHIRRLTR
ncbi:MAG: ATP-binding protein [Myxococcota bacterium]